jgi:hypothetical protein
VSGLLALGSRPALFWLLLNGGAFRNLAAQFRAEGLRVVCVNLEALGKVVCLADIDRLLRARQNVDGVRYRRKVRTGSSGRIRTCNPSADGLTQVRHGGQGFDYFCARRGAKFFVFCPPL